MVIFFYNHWTLIVWFLCRTPIDILYWFLVLTLPWDRMDILCYNHWTFIVWCLCWTPNDILYGFLVLTLPWDRMDILCYNHWTFIVWCLCWTPNDVSYGFLVLVKLFTSLHSQTLWHQNLMMKIDYISIMMEVKSYWYHFVR